MAIAGKNSLTVRDVLVGEVWVGSGQSNMAMPVDRSNNAEQEKSAANYPGIRFFDVKRTVSDTPLEDVSGSWKLCSPETVGPASAAGYFFSRDLHQKLKIPIGFIHSSWGGTPVQAWTSRPAMQAEPAIQFMFDEWEKTLANYPASFARYEEALAKWNAGSAARAPQPPPGPGHQYTPAGLYNAMIAPLTPYAIRGAIWYQGENNATALYAQPYRRMFRTMIEDWRHAWGAGDFPFLFVQLANFSSNGNWPVLRESQTDTLALKNTGMAVIIDIGESHDIHPKNKQDVGLRLAMAARGLVYHEKLVYSGPMYRQLTIEGDRARLWFDHAGGGLAARGGGELTGFTIAGKDGQFVPAEAKVDGKTIVVLCASVREPVAVRYAWEDDPKCNLVNREGLPASPFRTDK